MIKIVKPDFSQAMVISNVVSFHMRESYNSYGTFSVVISNLELDSHVKESIRNGYYLCESTSQFYGTIEDIQITKTQIVLNGYTLDWLLNTRVALFAGTKNTSKVEECIYSFFEMNKRGLAVETAPQSGIDKTVTISFEKGDKLGDVISNALAEQKLGYKVYLDLVQKKVFFQIVEGRDLTTEGQADSVMFSVERKNMKDMDGTFDTSDVVNAVLVCGEYLNGKSLIVQVSDSASTLPYREAYIEADGQQDETTGDDVTIPAETDAEFKARLLQKGKEYLADHMISESFNFEVVSDGFGERYKLGDVVYCRLEDFGIEFKTVINECEYVFDRTGHTQNITLGLEKRRRLKNG